MLNLARKNAVVKDDAAPIRVFNCSMALTVNFSRADQSLVGICLLALESVTPYPYSFYPCTRKPPRAEMSSPEAVLKLHSFACVSVPIFASSGDAEIAAPVSPSGLGCVSKTIPSPQSFPEPVAAVVFLCLLCFGSKRLACELTWVGFNAGLNCVSNLLVRDQSCTVHRKMLFQLTWNEGPKCSCLGVFIKSCCRRSARIALFISASQFLPVSRVLREDLAVCTDLEAGCAAEVLCAFLLTEDPNDGPNVAAPQDLMVLLQERYRSFHFLSKPKVQHGPVRSSPEHRQLVSHPADRTVVRLLRS